MIYNSNITNEDQPEAVGQPRCGCRRRRAKEVDGGTSQTGTRGAAALPQEDTTRFRAV